MALVVETDILTVSSTRYANGQTSLLIMTGKMLDITKYYDFYPFNWVWYKSNAGLGPPE